MKGWPACAALFLSLGLSISCIQAPEIVLVDRATALEHQAAGSFTAIEKKLLREGIVARPVPLTPDDLQALGIRPPPLADEIDLSEADRVDGLLVQHCIGEARDGLLADTHESCRGAADSDEARGLIDRVNRARQQLWRFLEARQARQPKLSLHEVRLSWRKAHLRGVACKSWVQGEDGKWDDKKC